MSKKDIFAILGVKTLDEVKEIYKYKLSPDHELSDCEINMITNVCVNYQINPNLGMLYLRRDNYNAIYPTLKVDGWYKLVNDQEDCLGFEFVESENMREMGTSMEGNSVYIYDYIGCKIYRKGREFTPLVKEYIQEVFNPLNAAYFTHGNRLLRHASFIQAARVVYNLSGIYDPNEEINFSKTDGQIENTASSDFEVVSAEATDEDDVIVAEPEATDEDDVIVAEPEATAEDDVIVAEPEATAEDDVVVAEPEATSEDNVIDLSANLPAHEITHINGYIERGLKLKKLNACVVFLKQQYSKEFHPYIDEQAKKVS